MWIYKYTHSDSLLLIDRWENQWYVVNGAYPLVMQKDKTLVCEECDKPYTAEYVCDVPQMVTGDCNDIFLQLKPALNSPNYPGNIRLVNLKKHPEAVYHYYVGRANKFRDLPESKWGNPFPMKNEGQRQEVLDKYYDYVSGNRYLMSCLPELGERILACWCFPKKCHSHVLIELYAVHVLGMELERGTYYKN